MTRTLSRFRVGLVALAGTVVSCTADSLEPDLPSVESVVVTPTLATISVGAGVEFSAQVLDETGVAIPDHPVHWSSEDQSIATVSFDGTVSAHEVGTVQVAASAGGRSGIAQVTVTITPVASVSVSPGNKALFIGDSWQFTAEARDAGGAVLPGRPIAWSSNNPSVSTVSVSGLVTALAPGGAIISATAEGATGLASVTASAVPVAAVRVSPDTQPLVVSQSAQLRAQPVDAAGLPLAGRVVLWSTNNPVIATVTSTGVVTANALGKAVITATCEGRAGTSVVDVGARPPNAVVITPAQSAIVEGSTVQLSAQVLDNQGLPAPGIAVTFSSSDGSTATVSASGLVTGVAPGKVVITATGGGRSGTANVTVTPMPVTSVVVSPSTAFLVIGKSVTLAAEARGPAGQVLTGRTVTWTSTRPVVASVSASGVVTGLSPGTSVIFATVDGVFGWASVTVAPVPVSTVGVTTSSMSPSASGVRPYQAEVRLDYRRDGLAFDALLLEVSSQSGSK